METVLFGRNQDMNGNMVAIAVGEMRRDSQRENICANAAMKRNMMHTDIRLGSMLAIYS